MLFRSCLFTLQTVVWADDDKPIQVNQLPQTAQTFIKTHFPDNKVAMAKMETDWFDKSYDVILMDVQMPHMDGYKATKTIRELSDEGKAHIPIVALTANAFEEDRKMAISKGMNDHIAKPIDVKKVEEVIISVLK